MARLFALVLVIHGLIHLLGFAKAFRLAELPQLTQPISPLFGLVWLAAGLLFVATALALLAWPRWWWALGAVAIGVSMIAISQSWTDARAGALANLVILVGVVLRTTGVVGSPAFVNLHARMHVVGRDDGMSPAETMPTSKSSSMRSRHARAR